MNNKTSLNMKGVLENAGLGEFAYYMKKSGQYANYAEFALENTNFNSIKGCPTTIVEKIIKLRKLAAEVILDIENLPVKTEAAVEEAEIMSDARASDLAQSKEAENENEETAKDSEGGNEDGLQ